MVYAFQQELEKDVLKDIEKEAEKAVVDDIVDLLSTTLGFGIADILVACWDIADITYHVFESWDSLELYGDELITNY
jgi:hypothetical protein